MNRTKIELILCREIFSNFQRLERKGEYEGRVDLLFPEKRNIASRMARSSREHDNVRQHIGTLYFAQLGAKDWTKDLILGRVTGFVIILAIGYFFVRRKIRLPTDSIRRNIRGKIVLKVLDSVRQA